MDQPPRGIAGPERLAVRGPGLAILIGLGVALVSIPLAAIAGPPYLNLAHVNPWLVIFAAGLFAALFATPFLVERSLRASKPQSDERWERALLVWAAVSVLVLAVSALFGLAGDFSSTSLAGSFGLVAVAESGMVLGTLVVLFLSN